MEHTDGFSHTDKRGKARMVDVSQKDASIRTARARGFIRLNPPIIEKITTNQLKKGDVLSVARIAAISAAKKTWELIPLCHQVRLTFVGIEFRILNEKNSIEAIATAKGADRTGVEMEALTAVSISLLAIYDMCKAMSKELRIEGIELLEKSGGRSDYKKPG